MASNSMTDYIPKNTEIPAELISSSQGGVGIKPEFVAENMNETYQNRRKHLNDWMIKKLLKDPASKIKINGSIVKSTADNLLNESTFTLLDYSTQNSTLKNFKTNDENLQILNTLNLVTLSASGDGLNCAFHSFLQAISRLFRALDAATKNKIASAFRFEYIKYVIINTNGSDMSLDGNEKAIIRDTYSSGIDEYDNPDKSKTNLVYFDRNEPRRNTPVNFIELNSFFFGYNVILYTDIENLVNASPIVKIKNPIHTVNDTIFICNRGGGHFETIGYKENIIYTFVFEENSEKMNIINTVTVSTDAKTDIIVKPNNVKINGETVTIYSTNDRDRTSLQTENTGCLIIYCFNTLEKKIYDNNTLKNTLKKWYKITDTEIASTIPNFCFMVFDYCENKKNQANPIKIYLILNFTFNDANTELIRSDLFFIKDIMTNTEEFRTNNFELTINNPIIKTNELKLQPNTYYTIVDGISIQPRLEPVARRETDRLSSEKDKQVSLRLEKEKQEKAKANQLAMEKDKLDRLAKEMELTVPQYLERIEAEKKNVKYEREKNDEHLNLVKEYYKKINKNTQNVYTQLKINKIGEMKSVNDIIKDTDKFDINQDIQTLIDNKVIKKEMFVLVNDGVYMIKEFGSIIVDRNFDKDYPVDTLIIFYSVEKQQFSNIISLILEKYNEKFDENENGKDKENIEKNCSTNYDYEYFRKLLIDITDSQIDSQNKNKNKELIFNTNIKVVNIHELNFIQDIDLVEKYVKFRKLEIAKQIRIVNYIVEVYKNTLTLILCYPFLHNKLKYKFDLENLNKNKQECIDRLKKIILNDDSYFLQSTLCRYIDLEEKLKEFKAKQLI